MTTNSLDNDKEEISEITCFISRFHIKTIIHSNVPVEYPSTSPEEIQYSMGGSGIHLIKKSLYFGNSQVYKEKRYCMGIKTCCFTDLSLINVEYNEVDVESSLWKRITESQNTEIIKSNTYIKYLAVKDNLCKFKDNNGTMCLRNPILYKSLITKDIYQWFIGCSIFIPQDLTTCPFIALVCVGTHNHPPLPPEKIPVDIKTNLQVLINQAVNKNNIITPRQIQSSNLIKAYFNLNNLSEIHQSLNSIDKLRIMVAKAYKNLYPYGQDILGVFHAVKINNPETKNYIHRIEWINLGLILIICILKEQAELLLNLKCFQINLSFKRIKGDLNEFEINTYNNENKLILSYCRIYTNVSSATDYKKLFSILFEVIEELTNNSINIYHIYNKGWECILGDLDAAQAKGLVKSIINALSQESVDLVLKEIEFSDEPNAKASRLKTSKRKAPIINNKRKKSHQETNSQMEYEVMAELETIVNVINSDNEIGEENKIIPQTTGNKENDPLLSIELEERKIALLECQVKARKEAAEAEAIELQNRQLRISLGLDI
ncbi:7204_t:CDS:10 [Scutellospora calospora]|uniref:7204_t:CDS:1 n=1 Tax=Scutellospora calospora TaxID=85575 RepID=A0ACA9KJY6_9GLOM|nr:7204_t:CDS:10 [Scutellospora calospora]